MPEDILVVEYEPRYTDRVKQALNGQPYVPRFARDGEEALKALSMGDPRLIVLSSVIPKISTNELIRRIRGEAKLQETPILITVSGYNGKSTRADAGKVGATDILPKPYSETEFLGKVKQLLSADGSNWAEELTAEFNAVPVQPVAAPGAALTSDDIFGDLVDEGDRGAAAKKAKRAPEDLDKLLEQTLSGVRVPGAKKKTLEEPLPVAPAPQPASQPAKASKSASADLDKFLSDTLSGLEKRAPRADAKPVETPRPVEAKPVEAKPVEAKPVETPKPPAPKPVEVPKPAPAPVAAAPVAAPAAAPLSDKEADDEKDGMRFGQYLLQERIATGGMAEVWKARMRGVEGFQKIVAIKKILPHLSDNDEFIEMFVDEAKLAAQLNHNNIIHIYDLGKISNSYYIAMEFIDGHDLKSIVKRGEERGQPMPIEIALFIASKIAAALDYAHRKRGFDEKDLGLVHRDVSPQNVLISYEGDIKLCDFGIAKAASKASHTQAGALKGKLQYMSPEQAWGKKIDKRSDIFALGTVLYELLTGQKLFSGDNELSILEQVREARISIPSDINDEATPEIDAIVTKALQKDADKRYQTAGEMARDIDQILYTFRPTPTSADLAIYMHRLYSEEPPMPVAVPAARFEETEPASKKVDLFSVPEVIEIPAPPPMVEQPPAPVVKPVPVVTPEPAPVVHEPAPMFGSHTAAHEEGKKFPVIPAAVIGVLVLAGILAFALTRSKTPAAPATAAAANSTSTAAPATTVAANTTTATAPTLSTAATSTVSTALGTGDQALVDQEVQKRLAAEKARLDQQKALQLAAQQKAAPTAGTPAPTTAPVQTATVAQQAPAPVAQPVVTQTQPEPPPQVVQQQPPPPSPAPAQPTVTRAKEGDLVDASADGLTPPALVRLREPVYPPAAKARRQQGTIIVSALVSEAGRVVEARVLRGVNPDLGLSAAALEAVRGSTFRPATKDGVRVRTYTSVAVNFKL